MKIPLTIKTDYLPDWGAWEGIRELVQNGKDAETELEAPLKVTHRNQMLVIENEGATMGRDVLLFGSTSKAGREDLIGRFGEGLKLGMLALVRAGRGLKIRVGDEVWSPTIERNEGFKSNVLTIDIKVGNEPRKRVRVEINGVTSVEWEEMRERFLFLSTIKDDERVRTTYGDLLLGERFKSKVYVKGIFVQELPKLHYGYNFNTASVDRDRKMVGTFDLDWTSAAIWKEAAHTRPDLFEKFIALATEDAQDVRGVGEYGWVDEKTSEKAAELFIKRHGPEALPVSSLAESEKVEHLGAKGVIVPKALAKILEPALGGQAELDKKFREAVVKHLAWAELTEEEQEVLIEAINLLAIVHPACTLERVAVVNFSEPEIRGMWKDNIAHIAHKNLVNGDRWISRRKTLRVLVHEFAHESGTDGTKSHVENIELIWEALVDHLRRGDHSDSVH